VIAVEDSSPVWRRRLVAVTLALTLGVTILVTGRAAAVSGPELARREQGSAGQPSCCHRGR